MTENAHTQGPSSAAGPVTRRPAVTRLATRPMAPRRKPKSHPPRIGLLVLLGLAGLALGGTYLIWRKAEGPEIAASEPLQKIEHLLATLNFPPGRVDGVFDAETAAAIRTFQEAAGLPVDGTPSQALLDELIAVTDENVLAN